MSGNNPTSDHAPGLTAASVPGHAPDLGEHLTTRASTIGGQIFAWLIVIVAGYAGLVFLYVSVSWHASPSGGTSTSAGGRIVGLVLSGLLLLAARAAFIAAASRYHFYERGATRTIFGSVRQRVEFARVEAMWYQVTRHYTNGIYTGTSVDLSLLPIAAGGKKPKKLSYNGKHREKPDGVLSRTFIKKNFKGEDELDAVKNIIALAIVGRWLSKGEFAEEWTGHGLLTPRGFLLTHNADDKGTVVPYETFGEIGASELGSDYRRITLKRPTKDFILGRPSDRNFWPGWLLVNMRKAEAAGGAGSGEATTAAPAGV
jgi:hypothetical protein